MERPIGTVCEHVRSADGPIHYLSISLFCLTVESLEGWKEQGQFFYARAI
jgi:hypothetical protein